MVRVEPRVPGVGCRRLFSSYESDLGRASRAVVGVHTELDDACARMVSDTKRLLAAGAANDVEGRRGCGLSGMRDTRLRSDLNGGRAHVVEG